ncbi:efflux RND transporter periplasmic adaptor subunit [Pseudomonas gingeri]|uniref:HlyD family efflux transporter periplasmic adaptor subunit n=1 Tax=Pseudomonas gingeri TaxID=117681 RepID=A0A7Y7YAE4_9PSED|nr:HlyD family efflux transporter periplasmic adaptor subunit [Pseudomonas gingeri]NWB26643.1 HlyD family efflux transporter periplasmic adaptor subunit [Pseudomonas gingeri]NWC32807.1 HlyD family efflux transporter periplasmic adaptor subunit [Pseudomonas gingeri]NWD07019.1 HlyD family efflux transporter periplasmic adaptor subunit [Pseudomonas gingeri]NWD52262.1 HlyD family efflux transporter periplasmic adaptor subunit [Pseudomonas gingeri]NWE31618.1 HlyD family efflux transporter periplasm
MTTDKQVRRRRWLQGAGLLLALAVAGVVVTTLRAPAADRPKDGHWIAVQASPLVHQIGLVGKIEPQKTITLTAPFEGNVRAVLVEQGQRVEAGQSLLQMDPGLLEIQLRDALSAQLKARRTVQELQDWNNSPQVARARRSLRTSQMAVSNSERKLRESQNLFQRGIIPRNELDDLQQQLQTQRLDLVAAEGDLQQALDQGKGEYRQIADMELTNATVKYEALHKLLEGKNVLAPFAGIVVPPPGANSPQSSTANSTGPVQAGSRVSQGQVLFGLANIEQLKIVSKVSELDINQLHQGQSVEILGDGFDGERLDGSVDIVSSLALPNDAPGGSAQFPVTLSVPKLTREQLQRVRLGMSARLTIITYRNDQAIILPAAAIQRTDKGLLVDYREAVDQPVKRLPITTGQATQEGVEVFGLQPGFVRLVE